MELLDTIELMGSEDYKTRFRAEYYQIKIRTEKLEKMLEQHKKGTLPFELTYEVGMLHTQYIFMLHYKETLEDRARIENIKL